MSEQTNKKNEQVNKKNFEDDLNFEEDGDSERHSVFKISLSKEGMSSELNINNENVNYKDNIKKPEVVEDIPLEDE